MERDSSVGARNRYSYVWQWAPATVSCLGRFSYALGVLRRSSWQLGECFSISSDTHAAAPG